jgi:hypothetical protein
MSNFKYGHEIIKMLEDQHIDIDDKVANTIEMFSYEIFERGISDGIKKGKVLGINSACKEIEDKIIWMVKKNEENN